MNLNNLEIIGHVAQDAVEREYTAKDGSGEIRKLQSFDVAVNMKRGDKENTIFFKVASSRHGAIVSDIKKGRLIRVTGPVVLSQRTHQGKVYTDLQVWADSILFMDKKPETTTAPGQEDALNDEELPFEG